VSELILQLDLEDARRETVVTDVSVRRDTVEFRCQGRLVGIANRDYLRRWLRHPAGVYAYDEMAWLFSGWSIGISIQDVVPGYFLHFEVLDRLRMHI
jgi:hypothetical protein